MSTFTISYSARETLPDRLVSHAASLGITPEELIKRFVDAGMSAELSNEPCQTGNSLDDFFVKNAILKKTH